LNILELEDIHILISSSEIVLYLSGFTLELLLLPGYY
jgi:hypothetical protein